MEITTVAWLICLALDKLIRRMVDTTWWALSLLPACAVLILYQTYHSPLAPLLALSLCLGLVVGFTKIPIHSKAITRSVLFAVLCFGLYYLAGAVSLLFGILVGIWCACAKRRMILGGGMTVVGAIVPWLVGTKLFPMTIGEAYSLAWPFGPVARRIWIFCR